MIYLGSNPVGITRDLPNTSIIDDTAGNGDTEVVWSADKTYHELQDKYEKPSTGIPASDLAAGVIPDVSGKADLDLITPDYSDLAFPVAQGKLCTHANGLYKAKQAISTSEEWTAAHWDETTVEAEINAHTGSSLVIPEFSYNDSTNAWVCDMTFSEIKSAAEANQCICCKYMHSYLLLDAYGNAYIEFKTVVISEGYTILGVLIRYAYDGTITVTPGNIYMQYIVAPDYAYLEYPVAEGTYCLYGGYLYKANQIISTSESFNFNKWDEVNITSELSLLKSALNDKYDLPSGGIPSSDMASAVQTSLGKADTAYQKPSGGIPASDIASGVIPDPTSIIDDTSGDGTTDKTWSANKIYDELEAVDIVLDSKLYKNENVIYLKGYVSNNNNAVTKNDDGTFTFGTSDYGTTIWGTTIVVPAGNYSLFPLPASGREKGFSFVNTIASQNNPIQTNNTADPVTFTNPTDQILYFGVRMQSKPSSSFTVEPYLIVKVDNGVRSSIKDYLVTNIIDNGFLKENGEVNTSIASAVNRLCKYKIPSGLSKIYISGCEMFDVGAVKWCALWFVQNGSMMQNGCIPITNKPQVWDMYELTIPENAEEIWADNRIRIYTSNDINQDISGRIAFLEKYSGDGFGKQWFGKTWYAYGTSITNTSSEGKYPTYLEQMSGMIFVNKGISGGGIGNLGAYSEGQVYSAICNTSDGKLNADLITLETGANDCNSSVPLGTIYDTGTTTLAGCLNDCIRYLQANTNAQIVIINSPATTTEPTETNKYYEWADMVEKICHMNRVHFIRNDNNMGYSKVADATKGSLYVVDNIHQTNLGGYIMAQNMWYQLRNIPCFYTAIPT